MKRLAPFLTLLLILPLFAGCAHAGGAEKQSSSERKSVKRQLEKLEKDASEVDVLPNVDPAPQPQPQPQPQPAPNPFPQPQPQPQPQPNPFPQPQPTPEPIPVESMYLSIPSEMEGEVFDWIKITASTNGKNVTWISRDKRLKVFPHGQLKDTKSTIVEGKEPGDYELLAFTSVQDIHSDPEVCIVRIHGPPAPNPPNPNPPGPTPTPPGPVPPGPNPPTPPPTPSAVAKSVVSIDNHANRSVLRGTVLGDVKFWTSIRAGGVSAFVVDWNNTEESADYAAKVKAAGLEEGSSVLVFLDKDNKVIGIEKIPIDDKTSTNAASVAKAKADIVSVIAKYTAKNASSKNKGTR